MKRTLMIDGDIVLFQIGRVTEDSTDFGDQLMESYDQEAAIRLIESELDSISKKTGYTRDEMVFAITDKDNFRKRFHPTYKSNRKNVRKPLGLQAMRQYMLDNMNKYQTIMMEELEADDIMGMYGTADPEIVGDVAIYSQDKDLFTIPNKQWCFKKHKFIYPTPFESVHFLYTQVLTGDVVDGYKGCPKIGKVKAAKALLNAKDELELLKACHGIFYKEYGYEASDKLLAQIQQARILHHDDYKTFAMHDALYHPYEIFDISPYDRLQWERECDVLNVKKKKKKLSA